MKRSFCIFVLTLTAAADPDIPKFARVNDHIYRGHQPRKEDYPQLARKGIHTVLDLRGGPIHEPHEQHEVEAAGMHYISLRLSGIFEPHDVQIAQILAVLQDSNRWPIFIHCRRGDDRLGMVIACYRMVQDHWTNQQALDEASSLGLSHFEVLMRRYIRGFDAARIQALEGSLAKPEP